MTIDDVRRWCAAADPARAAELDARWSAHADDPMAVITVFGSYDTGKSSLVRRLLVDAGEPTPEWLSISARHETFEVSEAQMGELRLRDTPGVAVGAADVRGQANTAMATTAIEPTDVLVVTVTSQLATGELSLLQEVLDRGWTPGSLWFVITRFDEAGADPDEDPDSYRELVEAKRTELRAEFRLGDDVPVYVVAQDPFQLGGDDPEVAPGVWDLAREWDGIAELTSAIADVPGSLRRLRADGEVRFWNSELRRKADRLVAEAPEIQGAAEQARAMAAATTEWRALLSDLDAAARAGLSAAIDTGIPRNVALGSARWDRLGADLRNELDEWLRRQGNELDRLLQDIDSSARRTRASAEWQRLNKIIEAARATAESHEVTFDDIPEDQRSAFEAAVVRFGPIVQQTLAMGIEALGSENVKVGGVEMSTVKKVVDGVLPIAAMVAPHVDDFLNDRTLKALIASATSEHLDDLRRNVKELAITEWDWMLQLADSFIVESIGSQGAHADACEAEVAVMEQRLREADRILQAWSSSTRPTRPESGCDLRLLPQVT